jgi:hypothetical protein
MKTNTFVSKKVNLFVLVLTFFLSSCDSVTNAIDGPPTSLDQHIKMVFNETLQQLPQQTSDRLKDNKNKILTCAHKKLNDSLDMETVNSIYGLLKKYKIEELDATNSFLFTGLNTNVGGAIGTCATEMGVSLF